MDEAGNRFNPNKLLIDPYSRELSHDPQVAKLYIDPNVYIDDYYGGDNRRNIDTGKIAPKSMLLLKDAGNEDFGQKPKRYLKDDVIYEVNVRSLTMMDSRIPENERGTFKGAGRKAKYLKELGITAVEFLPVMEFADEQNDDGDPRGDNFWGYMTLNYFSPNKRYSSDKTPGGPTREFKAMWKEFHNEGLKVFLDVVYNHTGEGILRRIIPNQGNPVTKEEIETALRQAAPSRGNLELQDTNSACIMSFTGLDNRSYYILTDGNKRYAGRGGCGGNLNYDKDEVRNLIIDSLKYWKDEMGVDGFRFDLAPVLATSGNNGNFWTDINSNIFSSISQKLPSRAIDFENGVDLIAEPWGDESSIDWLGKFPEDWSVWNKEFRDIMKTAINKYNASDLRIHDISKVISGSKEILWKKPCSSINYFVSHDDCNAMRNIFSFNSFFHLNEATIRSDQISWDQGGDISLQLKAVRNAFVILMLSAGVPMFNGGDELFRGIPPYADGIGRMNMVSVDDPDNYIDFSGYNEMLRNIEDGKEDLAQMQIKTNSSLYTYAFVKNLIHFRSKHAVLRPVSYFTGDINPQNGLKDISWHTADGSEIHANEWDGTEFLGFRINTVFESLVGEDKLNSIYVAYNRSDKPMSIVFPQNVESNRWYRVLDTDNTDDWMMAHNNFDGGNTLLETSYMLHDRSIIVLGEK